MLRFPLNKELILLTTSGILRGIIIKITNNYLILDHVLYNSIQNLGDNVFIDRKHVVGYTDLPRYIIDIDKLEKEEQSIKKCKIISFNEAISDV